MAEDSDFCLLSTPRFDPLLRTARQKGLDHAGWNYEQDSPLYLLDYHRDRLLKGATYFGWSAAIEQLEGSEGLNRLSQQLSDFIGDGQVTPLRLRILVGRDGNIEFGKFDFAGASLEQLFPRSLPPPGPGLARDELPRAPEYTLLVDSERTSSSEHTYFKTTSRPMYDDSRKRAMIGPKDLKEVLIVSLAGFVTEGSITTPYFWRDERWVTPPVSTEFRPADETGGQDGVSRRWAIANGIAVEQAVKVESLVDGEECWLSNGARGFMYARIRV